FFKLGYHALKHYELLLLTHYNHELAGIAGIQQSRSQEHQTGNHGLLHLASWYHYKNLLLQSHGSSSHVMLLRLDVFGPADEVYKQRSFLLHLFPVYDRKSSANPVASSMDVQIHRKYLKE